MFKRKKLKKNKWKYLLFGLGLLSIILFGMFLSYHNNPIFMKDYYYDDFENQIVGQEPIGWFEHKDNENIKIYKLDQNKVVRVWDTSNDCAELVKRFGKTKRAEIEFMIYGLKYELFTVQIVQMDNEYALKDDIILDFGDITSIKVQINKQHYRVNSFKIKKWYNVKIKFDVEDDWELEIDGVDKGSWEYHTTPWYFSQLYFYTHTTPMNYGFYVDNVSITILERY